MKVRIEDFQVIKKAELEFSPGVTVIVGNSNNGKSSIIRAIEAAINNKGGNGFINYDADACSVEIEDQGHVILWTKSKKQGKSEYTIDGKVLKKIGRQQLDEVGELLNMGEIQVNQDRFRLNFWKQLEYPFLVGKTTYQLFDFISKSKEQEVILSLQDAEVEKLKQVSKDIDAANANIDMKTAEAAAAEEAINAFKKYADFDITKLELIIQLEETLSAAITSFNTLANDVVEKATQIASASFSITKLETKLESVKASVSIATELANLLDLYAQYTTNIESITETINAANKFITSKEVISIKIGGLLDNNSKISVLVDQLSTFIKEYNDMDRTTTTTQENITNKTKEIAEIEAELAKFTVCPLCGQSMNNHGGKHE